MKNHRNISHNFSRCYFVIIVVALLFVSCHNPVDSTKKEILKANAGGDQTSYVGSYILLDASKTKLLAGEQISDIEWIADSTNPEKILINEGDNRILDPWYTGFDKEGKYKITLNVTSTSRNVYTDDMTVIVKPRQAGLMVDANLEIQIRYKNNYPVGDLSADRLHLLDTINVALFALQNPIRSLEGIEHCSNLTFLSVGLEKIVDLKPLSSLIRLEFLDVEQNRTIEDISPIYSLTSLKTLILFSDPIKDISGLSNLINLKELDLNWTPISDISSLTNLVNLEILFLAGVTINSSFITLEPLRNLTKLKQLTLYDRSITDITPLQNLTELNYLALSYNSLTNISALSRMNKLLRLEIDLNNINDMSGIKNLINLDYLSADNNQIKDISELQYLPKIHVIGLSGNKIEDLLPLVNNTNIGKGVYIFLSNNPLNQKSINEYIPALIARGVVVYL